MFTPHYIDSIYNITLYETPSVDRRGAKIKNFQRLVMLKFKFFGKILNTKLRKKMVQHPLHPSLQYLKSIAHVTCIYIK